MPTSTMNKIKKALMESQTLAAKIIGTPRIHVIKTDRMSEKALSNYREQCDEFIELAGIAKRIETAADTGGLKNISHMARKCKINIKSDFEKFVKEMSKSDGDFTLSSRHLESSKAEIKKLLSEMRTPIVSMIQIHDMCVQTYNGLRVPERIGYILSAPQQPTAPPAP